MTVANGERTYQLKALTDLWTGDLNGKSGHLITTGLLGSIRWWFEVLVRGLDGSACDPIDTKCEDRNHCVVCELFGREVRDNTGTTNSPRIEKGVVPH